MANGEYSIEIPAGTYTVTASKEGYSPQQVTAEVAEGMTTVVDFQLSEEEPTEPTKSRLPLILIGAAGVAAAASIIHFKR